MRFFSPSALRVWQRNRDVFLALSTSEVPGLIAEPLLVLLAMGVGLGAYVIMPDGQDYMEFIAPGIIAGYGMFSATFECTFGSFVRMDYQKTYDAIIASPLSVEDVVAGEIFWGATRAFINTAAVLLIATAFGLVQTPMALLALPMGLLSGLMFASIAFVFTSIAPAISTFNYYFTLVITPMFYFSGVFFPLDSFPEIVQKLSWIAPLTPVTAVMRAVVQ
ncbi:MAG: ABC transporter permease, partial [Chloroflexota bacterium]|nr:ABC transporter permease [Chloroflexota bacterium]